MTNEKTYLSISPDEWSTAQQDRLTVRGQQSRVLAGRKAMVVLDLGGLAPEERYALARTWAKWCDRVERQALADIETEAQAPLFDM